MTIKGQILADSLFANHINDIIKTYKPSTIVEIGTWKGLGSTKRIIESIIQYNLITNFISLETNWIFYNEAKNNLQEYVKYVNLIYGKIVDIKDIIHFLSLISLSDIEQTWLNNDIDDYEQTPNVLYALPNKIDFLLLDGGEFSTYSEWLLLKDRSHIIALDDTKTTKCKLIKKHILNNKQYNIIIDSDDRNGFTILENKHYVQ